jgi:hypothetical protein
MTTKRFKKPKVEMTTDPSEVEPLIPTTVELLLADFVAMER